MTQEWKIYTRQGDKGETSLIGGTRVPKDHIRIECYGTVDELNAFVGLLRDQAGEEDVRLVLLEIMDRLFTLESLLAADPEGIPRALPELQEADALFLEQEIDRMNTHLPALTQFILPGGHPLVSLAHVARTVCRRAERLVIGLAREHPVDPRIIQYLNRLSDYFFVLARYLGMKAGAEEIVWKPRY